MLRTIKGIVNHDAELAIIDEKIEVYEAEIRRLTKQRYELLSRMKDVDMDIVLQYIVKKGLTSGEVIRLIESA